jgi:allantoinase
MAASELYGKKILTPEGFMEATVSIRDGRISAVTPGRLDTPELTDLGEKMLVPGFIDPHVHINEPGRTEWEGFDTATRAALASGITLLVEMPLNASPVTTTVAAYEQKLEAAQGKLHTDCSFWGGVVPGNQEEILPLIKKGIPGFKAFLTPSGIDEFPDIDEAGLRKVMPLLAEYGIPLLVHCELTASLDHKVTDPRSYAQYLASRPAEWEERAIALMIRLCREYKTRVHIVHLSAASALPMIREAKEAGLPLTVETAQHYLYFSAEQIPDGATAFKCAPPIRERSNKELLWKALKEGLIDFVATDHSPAPPEMKETGSGDFIKAWGGIASLQWAFSSLWTAAQEHGCTMEQISSWLSAKPAVLAGQDHERGKIKKGYRADLAVIDPSATFTVAEKDILHRHRITPYLGEELKGRVEKTWLNGRQVFEHGKFLHLNKGRIINRK